MKDHTQYYTMSNMKILLINQFDQNQLSKVPQIHIIMLNLFSSRHPNYLITMRIVYSPDIADKNNYCL